MSLYQTPQSLVGEPYVRKTKLRREAIFYAIESMFFFIFGSVFGLSFLVFFLFGHFLFEKVGLSEKVILSCFNVTLFGMFFTFFQLSMIFIEVAKMKWRAANRILDSPFQ